MEQRVLIVLTFRPEFSPPWTGESHVLFLALSRLSPKQSAMMVEHLATDVSQQELEQIVARTDGIPLFLEELTQAVRERLSEGNAPSIDEGIPRTLAGSLTARLDRLGVAKQVAQVGATIGREFPYRLLAAVSSLELGTLETALIELEASGLVWRRGQPPDAEYQFKHALVQDAAYAGLLRQLRKDLNLRVAEALHRLYPERAEAEPELLARHYSEAGDVERSVKYWQRAVDRAVAKGASREGSNNARNGLQQLRELPEGLERDRVELELQTALAACLLMTDGWAADSTFGANEAARKLSLRLSDKQRLGEALLGIFNYQIGVPELHQALETCDQLFSIGDEPYQMLGCYLASAAHSTLGEFEAARDRAARAVELGERITPPDMPYWHINDPLSPTLGLLACAPWLLGYPDQARRAADRGLERARYLGRPYPLAMSLGLTLVLENLFERDRVRLDYVEEMDDLSTEHSFGLFASEAQSWRRYASMLKDRTAIVAAAYRGALVPPWGSSYITSSKLEELSLVAPEEAAEAMGLLDALLHQETKVDCRACESDLHRRKGELFLMQSNIESAEQEFKTAIRIAIKQKAKSWELRAALNLARLWRDQGKPAEAQNVLAPIYDWFTEGFDTPDLRDAKALLDGLS